MKYPYFIIITHAGRLECPPQYRGTPIARDFASGRIGGRRSIEDRTDSVEAALRKWANAKREDRSPEFWIVESPNRCRQRIHHPETDARLTSGGKSGAAR